MMTKTPKEWLDLVQKKLWLNKDMVIILALVGTAAIYLPDWLKEQEAKTDASIEARNLKHHLRIEEFKKCVRDTTKELGSGSEATSYCAVTLQIPIPYTRK